MNINGIIRNYIGAFLLPYRFPEWSGHPSPQQSPSLPVVTIPGEEWSVSVNRWFHCRYNTSLLLAPTFSCSSYISISQSSGVTRIVGYRCKILQAHMSGVDSSSIRLKYYVEPTILHGSPDAVAASSWAALMLRYFWITSRWPFVCGCFRKAKPRCSSRTACPGTAGRNDRIIISNNNK